MRLPGGMEPDESVLRGLVVAETTNAGKFAVFLPLEELPSAAEALFAALFGAKKQWVQHELEPYVTRLVTPAASLPKLLMKHARSTTTEDGTRAFVAR